VVTWFNERVWLAPRQDPSAPQAAMHAPFPSYRTIWPFWPGSGRPSSLPCIRSRESRPSLQIRLGREPGRGAIAPIATANRRGIRSAAVGAGG